MTSWPVDFKDSVLNSAMGGGARRYHVVKNDDGTCDFALSRFFEHMNKKLADISTNDIRLYLYEFQRIKQCKDVYLDSIRLIINGFMERCVRDRYMQRNPCKPIGHIHFEQKPREPLTNVEM